MAAPLFFVANNQINLGIPTASGLVDGKGTLVITNTDGSLITSTVTVQRAKAGIFTFAANGQGAPAGFVTPDGVNFMPLFKPDGTPNPVPVSTGGKPNFIVLFLTGLRNTPGAPAGDPTGVAKVVTLSIGNQTVQPSFAGAQNTLFNLDQVNAQIPGSLAGAGTVM